MFGHPRRGDRRGDCPGPDAHSNSQHSWDRHRIRGTSQKLPALRVWTSQKKRMSCICPLVISRTSCPSVSRSEQLMWSRDGAAKTGICAYFRAMWSCPAAGGSTSRTILWARQRPVLAAAHGTRMEPKVGERARRAGRKKLWHRAEPRASAAVDSQAPGEAPQPLTLNHPASNPGRFSGRGSSFHPPDCGRVELKEGGPPGATRHSRP